MNKSINKKNTQSRATVQVYRYHFHWAVVHATYKMEFMVTPCVNDIKYFIFQLTHSNI